VDVGQEIDYFTRGAGTSVGLEDERTAMTLLDAEKGAEAMDVDGEEEEEAEVEVDCVCVWGGGGLSVGGGVGCGSILSFFPD
jgi:hypothetical protein